MSKAPQRTILGAGAVSTPPLAPTVAHAETESHDSGEKPATTAVTLDLCNLTDIHGCIERVKKKEVVRKTGLPVMDCYLKQARTTNPNSFFTLLGNNIGASPCTSGSLKDNSTIAALNTMSPLTSAIDNHEFDMGQAVLKQRVDGSSPGEFVQVGFPYLGASIEGMGTWTKGGVETPYLGSYEVWTLPLGVKAAFIGAIAEDIPYKLSPDTTAELSFTDPLAKIDALAKSIKDKDGAQIVIATLDDGVKSNYLKVNEYVNGIMGGDTHVPYEFDEIDSAEELDSEDPLLAGVTSGSYTNNLSLVRIVYGAATRKVLSADTQLIPTAKVTECDADPEAQAVVNQAVADSQEAGKAVVGTGYTQPFRRDTLTVPGGETSPGSNRGIESSLGSSVADAMRETILVEGNTPVDISIINAGDLHDDLTPNEDGTITYAQPYSVMPFSNRLGYVSITGTDFRRALEQQWKTDLNSQSSCPLLKPGISSNVHCTYDPAEPYDRHIASVMVNNEPLGPTKIYAVGLMTFLLAGEDSFNALAVGDPARMDGNLDRNKFNEFLAAHSGITPRMAESSINLSLPTRPLTDGTSLSTPVRGFSFSEDPSITQNVTLSFDASEGNSPVDSSLLDEHASDEAAVIAINGVRQANIEAEVLVGQRCEGRIEDDVADVPVSVSTDFVEVVTANQGLSVPIVCPAHQVMPGPEDQRPTPGENNTGRPGKQAGKDSGNNFVETGSSADILGLGAPVLALVGAGMSSHKRA